MTILDLFEKYKAEEKKWADAGKPMRTRKRMKEIHTLCQGCPFFREGGGFIPGYDQCGICKCNLHPSRKLMNKIAWATTRCPKTVPEWTEDTSD